MPLVGALHGERYGYRMDGFVFALDTGDDSGGGQCDPDDGDDEDSGGGGAKYPLGVE